MTPKTPHPALLAIWLATLAAAAPLTAQTPEVPKTWIDHTWTGPDGTSFHYVEQGEGTPVVLIHGFTSSAVGNWFRTGVGQKLARTNRVLALDMRGHGDTGPSPDGSDGTMIQDVIDFMDHLGIEQAHIAGYSMGGATTAGLMREAPERFITGSLLGIGVAPPGAEPPPPPPGTPPGAPSPSQPVDLAAIDFPVLAINGSEDRPIEKTEPMWRALGDFKNVVVPGRDHRQTPRDPMFGDELARFIAAHNP